MQEPDIGLSLGTDHYLLTEELTDREREAWDRTREFVDTRLLPVINDYWDRAEFRSRWSPSWPSWTWRAPTWPCPAGSR